MRRRGPLILIGLIFYCALGWGQEIYQWVDEKGTIHFTDDLSQVPESHRDQVKKKKPPQEPSPTPSPQISREIEREEKPEPPSQRKDLLGRGEEWWRTKAKEWSERLLNASKNYDTAFAAWKAKEKELEESKFKPKSLQRKLKSEMKALEEKVNDWKKQREEAENMLEKVLPKEAEELKADPEWIKIE
jgi:hypothetical protein